MASQDRFGYEWDVYSSLNPHYEIQFRRWVAPLDEKDFKGGTILDAGCGMGRNSYYALQWGAKKVVAFDYDQRSVKAARRNLYEFGHRAKVFFKSIYDIDWENEFDLVFSIGVIHHLEDPKKAIQNLVKAVKPGGKILIWVYSYEGNERIVRFVNPIRKYITSKLPVQIVHLLSYCCSIPLWVVVKMVGGGATPYLKQLSTFSFKHLHLIVFDQLIPAIAHYWTKEEARALFENLPLKDIIIQRSETKVSWTVIGTKC